MNPDREEEREITRRVVITVPFQEREWGEGGGGGGSELPWIAIPRAPSFPYRPSEKRMGLGPVWGAGAGARIRSQLHLKPREANQRRRGRGEGSRRAPNCQMVNIFIPFQRRINCRAARGLRRSDQSGRGFWPWLSPQTPPTAPHLCRAEAFWSQSFAHWATWVLTFLGLESEEDDDQAGRRVFWEQEKGGRKRWWVLGRVSSLSPTFPLRPLPLLHPASQLLVYISPKDVIELNKAFAAGQLPQLLFVACRKARHFKSTYICSKLAGQIGGRAMTGPRLPARQGARSCEQFTGRAGGSFRPPWLRRAAAHVLAPRSHAHSRPLRVEPHAQVTLLIWWWWWWWGWQTLTRLILSPRPFFFCFKATCRWSSSKLTAVCVALKGLAEPGSFLSHANDDISKQLHSSETRTRAEPRWLTQNCWFLILNKTISLSELDNI